MFRNRYLAFYFFKKETSGKGFLFLHSEYILFCEAPIKATECSYFLCLNHCIVDCRNKRNRNILESIQFRINFMLI